MHSRKPGGQPSAPKPSPLSAGQRGPPPQQQQPATSQLSPFNQQSQRRPFAAPTTPGPSPSKPLLPPSARGPPPPGLGGRNLNVPGGPPTLKSKTSDSSLESSFLSHSISDKYSLGAHASFFDGTLDMNRPEPDDHIHNPDPRRDLKNDSGGTILTARGLANLGCLAILAGALITLFAGYPIITYFTTRPPTTNGAYNLGGINATGQVPSMPGNWALIDADTPPEAYTHMSYHDGTEMELVFSDEFNTDGRTFYPGDDPYWEALDLHYWGTNNLEWYDPKAITTEGGNLVITLTEERNHDLNYTGGMMTTWNKFCFTGGMLQVKAVMPGSSSVMGLWPAVWTLGNLGRAGYGSTLDGLWPYSYDTCDVGTLPNQTMPDGTPAEAATGGYEGSALSYLPGQRLSACTCHDDPDHPGPVKADGDFTGRACPEIDVFETQVSQDGIGHVSQSAQFAPFDYEYRWRSGGGNSVFHSDMFHLNDYRGGHTQETTSALGTINQQCFELSGGCFSVYGFEYAAGNDGYITWISDDAASWTAYAAGLGPDPQTRIGQRPIPPEPLYIITNLGISMNFGGVDFDNLKFPAKMLIDWVRVYQPKGAINIGCDPKEYPTAKYIEKFPEAYTNPNFTTWKQYGQTWPKNRMVDVC